MAHQPAGAASGGRSVAWTGGIRCCYIFGLREDSHEARAAGDHDVLDIRPGLELGGAREDRRILPRIGL